MNQNRAAIRYSKATLDLATEKKAIDKVEKDMRLIAATLAESVELSQLLESPVVKMETKKQALSKIFKGSHGITLGLINTLAEKERIEALIKKKELVQQVVFL